MLVSGHLERVVARREGEQVLGRPGGEAHLLHPPRERTRKKSFKRHDGRSTVRETPKKVVHRHATPGHFDAYSRNQTAQTTDSMGASVINRRAESGNKIMTTSGSASCSHTPIDHCSVPPVEREFFETTRNTRKRFHAAATPGDDHVCGPRPRSKKADLIVFQ